MLSSSIYGQEIGSIMNGTHSVSVVKHNNIYACVYSDVSNAESFSPQKSFVFPYKESIYNIIIDGFKSNRNHQTFVQTDENTVVKFDYKRINGRMTLKIRHNNLNNNVIGISTPLTRDQVDQLFEMEVL